MLGLPLPAGVADVTHLKLLLPLLPLLLGPVLGLLHGVGVQLLEVLWAFLVHGPHPVAHIGHSALRLGRGGQHCAHTSRIGRGGEEQGERVAHVDVGARLINEKRERDVRRKKLSISKR